MSSLLPAGARRIGLGCMRLVGDEGAAIVRAALDAGVRLLDTADVYGTDPSDVGANERLVGRALRSWSGDRDEVVVATKGGLRRRGNEWFPDGRAKHIRAACESSLEALGVDVIDLYQLHATDPRVPLPTTLRALAALVSEGKVRRVGLSNVSLEELEAAAETLPVASVQVALSPLDLTAMKNGVVSYCVRNGIPLLAHSPLGGHRASRRLQKEPALATLAARQGASVFEVALAWLLGLHPLVIPLPGATRRSSLESSVRALGLELTDEDRAELDDAYPAARVLGPSHATKLSEDSEIVLFVGYPAAGKSTLARKWIERGYVRLNRDEKGGSLRKLLPELEVRLSRGERRIVLDNTYPRRASRFDVIEIARRHGVLVTCVSVETTLEQAQTNAVERMIARYGRLLGPEEVRSVAKEDPNAFLPDAQFRYRRQLEPPRLDEGFERIERVEPEWERRAGRTGRGLFFEYDGFVRRTRSGAPRPSDPGDVEIRPRGRDALRRYAEEGYRLLGVSYQPDIPEERVRACFERTNELLGLDIDARFCPHPPGPAVCWCRKPLPGLGVLLIEEHGLDAARSLVVVISSADRGFADRLSIPTIRGDAL